MLHIQKSAPPCIYSKHKPGISNTNPRTSLQEPPLDRAWWFRLLPLASPYFKCSRLRIKLESLRLSFRIKAEHAVPRGFNRILSYNSLAFTSEMSSTLWVAELFFYRMLTLRMTFRALFLNWILRVLHHFPATCMSVTENKASASCA